MLLRSRMAAALQHREPDRVPIGELVVDWRIAEEALGMKTLYHSEWREWTALWAETRSSPTMSVTSWASRGGLSGTLYLSPQCLLATRSTQSQKCCGDHRWRDDKSRIWRKFHEAGGLPHAEYHPPMSIEDAPDPSAPVTAEESEFEAIDINVELH